MEILAQESQSLQQNASTLSRLAQELNELERQECDVDEALAEYIMTLTDASRTMKSYKHHRHLQIQTRHLETVLEHILIAAQPGAEKVPGTKRLAAEKLRDSTKIIVSELCDAT